MACARASWPSKRRPQGKASILGGHRYSLGQNKCLTPPLATSEGPDNGRTRMALDLETREQLLDTVARFVAERLRPIEAKVAEDDAVPADVVEEMKRSEERRVGRE